MHHFSKTVLKGLNEPPHLQEDHKNTVSSQKNTSHTLHQDATSQQFTKYQFKQIKLFRNYAEKQGIDLQSSSTTDECLSRFLSSQKYCQETTARKIKKYLQWMHNPSIQTLTETTNKLINSGCIYTFGRDKQHRSVIYIRMNMINLVENQVENYFAVFHAVVESAIQNCCMSRLRSVFTVVMDVEGINISKLPINGIINAIKTLLCVFPMLLGSLYVINSTPMVNIIYKTLQPFLTKETTSKITFFNPEQLKSLTKFIDSSNLQKRYKGQHHNLTTFWPPTFPKQSSTQYTSNLTRTNQEQEEQVVQMSDYYSISDRNQLFRNTSIELETRRAEGWCCKNQCSIF